MLIVKSPCIYCHGTGDWRGVAGRKHADYQSKENMCYHCKGTGILQEQFDNCCKYCGKPCNGAVCKSCYQDFEENIEEDEEEG